MKAKQHKSYKWLHLISKAMLWLEILVLVYHFYCIFSDYCICHLNTSIGIFFLDRVLHNYSLSLSFLLSFHFSLTFLFYPFLLFTHHLKNLNQTQIQLSFPLFLFFEFFYFFFHFFRQILSASILIFSHWATLQLPFFYFLTSLQSIFPLLLFSLC